MSLETALARRYIFEVDTAYPSATPTWEQVPGQVGFKDGDTPTDQRDSDYDSDGAIGYTRTADEWMVEQTLSYKEDDTTYAIEPTHSFIKARCKTRYGKGTVLHIRYYDRNGNEDAYEGYAIATWAPEGGDDEQLDRNVITYKPSATPSPVLQQITNPVNETPVPVITSLDPATGPAAGGTLVAIYGAHFTGATLVEFGSGNTASEFNVESDSVIYAVSPAVAASTVNVEVTTGNGTNADTAADDYVYV